MRRLRKIPPLVAALTLAVSSLAQNAQPTVPDNSENSWASCPVRSLLFNFDVHRFGEIVGEIPIWHLRDDAAFFFTFGMAIDADGAPNAYNADNTGLDDLSNAGYTGHWNGLLQDVEGNPLVQGPDDPFPGYYISCTALADWTKDRFDPTRFIDASKIPYIALPGDLARATGARLGDLAAVFNLRNGRRSFAIFADIGTVGEGSIALADNLGIWSDARRGGSWGGVVYVVFPGSGDHRPKSVEEINGLGARLLEDWGGPNNVRSCADYRPAYRRAGSAWIAPWNPPQNEASRSSESEAKSAPDTASEATSSAHANTD